MIVSDNNNDLNWKYNRLHIILECSYINILEQKNIGNKSSKLIGASIIQNEGDFNDFIRDITPTEKKNETRLL